MRRMTPKLQVGPLPAELPRKTRFAIVICDLLACAGDVSLLGLQPPPCWMSREVLTRLLSVASTPGLWARGVLGSGQAFLEALCTRPQACLDPLLKSPLLAFSRNVLARPEMFPGTAERCSPWL
ncbi:unnamed protein product [Symbiodinium natans]|uniref:Uncharacterized protein n=1 Tax=Symbiodinium natans TaxID=878477 RepID=A0A812JHH6_9DINO|nr:unnamed protein product [Symbiodinium natans]